MPLGRWCLIAWPLALLASLVIAFSVVAVFFSAGFESSAIPKARTPGGLEGFARVVLLAPLQESAILAAGLWLLTGRVKENGWAALISACVWGVMHGLKSWLWFFGVVWSFFVFSCGWLAWSRISLWKGFVAAALPHFLINLTVWIVRILL